MTIMGHCKEDEGSSSPVDAARATAVRPMPAPPRVAAMSPFVVQAAEMETILLATVVGGSGSLSGGWLGNAGNAAELWNQCGTRVMSTPESIHQAQINLASQLLAVKRCESTARAM